jgi:hypothetical protein
MAFLWKAVRLATACGLTLLFAVPQNLIAQTHVVSPADLQKAAVAASQARQRNIETIRQFLSTPAAEKAMQSLHSNPEQVKQAVSSLSNEELANLASRANKAQADFAAGNLSDRDLIIIAILILALILIIIAVR